MKSNKKGIVLPYDWRILERMQRASEFLRLTPEQRAAKAKSLAQFDEFEVAIGMKPPPAKKSGQQNGQSRNNLPDSADVRDLCRLLQKNLPTGRKQIEIALEFTGNDNKKAKSLLRQARRFRHLWQ